MDNKLGINATLEELEVVHAVMDCEEKLIHVYKIFEADIYIPGIIILKDNRFYNMLPKARFFELMSKQFMYDLFLKRTVQYFFDETSSENYLMLDSRTLITEAARLALERQEKFRFDPVIVYFGQNDYRLLGINVLLLAQNEVNEAALALIRESNEFKKDLMRILSHDLRNPLSGVLGISNLIVQSDDIVKIKSMASHMAISLTNITKLVNDFVNSALADSTELSMNLSDFNLIELLDSSINNLKPLAQNKNQNIKFSTSDKAFLLHADIIRLREVFENIISNAIKYSPLQSQIFIDVAKNHSHITVKIKDEGPGFTPEDLSKVFNKFQKLSAKPTGNETSTGLGLFIVKKIIDKHKGDISIETAVGKGSTFVVTLPLPNAE